VREPPFVAGRFGSAAAAAVVAAVADLLPFVVVVAWFPVAGAVPPFDAGGPPLPAMPPGNDAPRRPRAMLRFPAASWACRRTWRMPWPFAPCAIGRPVAMPFAGCAGLVAVVVPQLRQGLLAPGRPQGLHCCWRPGQGLAAPVVASRRRPTPPVACAVGAVAGRSWLPGGDGLAAGSSDGARNPSWGRPVPVPLVVEQGVAVAVAAAADVVAGVVVVVADVAVVAVAAADVAEAVPVLVGLQYS